MNNEHMYSCIDDLEVALGDGDLKDFAPQPHFAPQPYFPSVQMAPPQRAPPELLPQRAPPATTSYAYGEHSYELVPSREQLGPLRPSNNTMHGLEEHAAANVLVRHLVKTHKEMFKAQTQVLTKMSNKLEGFDNRLTRYEARLKRLELLEQKRQQTPLNGEASARAPPIPNQTSAALAPIPASASLSMPAPIQAPPLMPAPDPIASSARASGAREPPGWSKLNVQARELVRRVASDRLANVYRGALGNEAEWDAWIIPQQLTPEYMALTGRDWPLSAKHTFAIAMWLTRAERDKLPGSPARNRPSAAVAAHEAPAAADG